MHRHLSWTRDPEHNDCNRLALILACHRSKNASESWTKSKTEWRTLWDGDSLSISGLRKGKGVYLALAIVIFLWYFLLKLKHRYAVNNSAQTVGYISTGREICVWLAAVPHWGRVTHICVSILITLGSDNGLSPGWRPVIIWSNDGILLIWTLGTNFSEISIKILKVSFKKRRLNGSSAKWRPFCIGLNVLDEVTVLWFNR